MLSCIFSQPTNDLQASFSEQKLTIKKIVSFKKKREVGAPSDFEIVYVYLVCVSYCYAFCNHSTCSTKVNATVHNIQKKNRNNNTTSTIRNLENRANKKSKKKLLYIVTCTNQLVIEQQVFKSK